MLKLNIDRRTKTRYTPIQASRNDIDIQMCCVLPPGGFRVDWTEVVMAGNVQFVVNKIYECVV